MTINFQSTPPPHVTDYGFESNEAAWHNFVFPNGRGANVSISKWPFRFDVEYDAGRGLTTEVGLTTEQVEAKLTEIAELSAPQNHRMVSGSHERPGGAECLCGAAWDRWNDECAATAVPR
jgi:hypothetical protein